MAAAIQQALGVDSKLISGAKGEFTVRVDGRIVAQKSGDDFPSPERCLEQVRGAIESPS